MKSLDTIQKMSKIGKFLSKIAFIFSVIGFCGCIAGLLSLSFGNGSLIKIGGVTLHGLIIMVPQNQTTTRKIIVNMVKYSKNEKGDNTMTRRTYTPEYKAKLVIEVLQGEKELNTIAAENNLSPNMLRNWKAEFLENASRAFDGSRQEKEARRKEADLKKTQNQMLKTIGQLTLERDFLQGCFRKAGYPIPKLPSDDQ